MKPKVDLTNLNLELMPRVASIQEKYNEYINSDIIDKILDRDLEKVTSEAKKKYEIVKEKVGFSR